MFKSAKWFAIGFVAGLVVGAGGAAAGGMAGGRPSEWMERFGGCGDRPEGSEPSAGPADDGTAPDA